MQEIEWDTGSVTAEWACATVAAVSMVFVLWTIAVSEWFEDQLYRPFELAMGWLF